MEGTESEDADRSNLGTMDSTKTNDEDLIMAEPVAVAHPEVITDTKSADVDVEDEVVTENNHNTKAMDTAAALTAVTMDKAEVR